MTPGSAVTTTAAPSAAAQQHLRPAPRDATPWLAAILVLYALLTLAYGAVNPLFEAPDELWHYFTAQYIADTGTLPAVAPGDDYDTWLSQEAAQPPLYYILGAAIIAPLDAQGARDEVWLNEFAVIGNAATLANRNRVVHTGQENWPWQGYVLAAHLLRLFSTLLGLGTLLFIYLSGRLLWPRDSYPPLLATALVAFLPQFNFLHASISNDTLIIFLATAALWQLIRLWQTELTTPRLLLLGLTVGLAALTKNAGLVLLLFALGWLFLLLLRDGNRDWRLIVRALGFVAVPALLIAGWLWWRNWTLYGDITAANQFIRIAGGDRGYTPLQVLGESTGLWLSLFAVFGWFNLRPPEWVYWFWNAVVLLAAAGVLIAFVRSRRTEPHAGATIDSGFWQRIQLLMQQPWVVPFLLALWVFAVYAGLFTFMLRTEAAQGRLLFPALLPLALALAYGLSALPQLRRLSALLPPTALAISLYCLFFVIRPAYAAPVTSAALPEEAAGFSAHLGRGLVLRGATLETPEVRAGEPVRFTLYWRGESLPAVAPELIVSVFGRDMTEVAKYHGYHGRGLLPASLWEPGVLVAEQVALRLDEDLQAPSVGRIVVGLEDGKASVQVGEVKILPDRWPQVNDEPVATVDDTVEVLATTVRPAAAGPGDTVAVDVTWRAVTAPERDLTTLVHLGQPDQPPLAVADRPPLNGDFPTRLWAPGEVIVDRYLLDLPADLPPGRHPLWIGMYDSEMLERLPLSVEGERQPRDVYLAGWIEVAE